MVSGTTQENSTYPDADYPDRLRPSGRFVENSTKLDTFIVSPCIFVHLVLSPTYEFIYITKILSQAITSVALFSPTCFDPYGSSSGSTAGPC